MVEGASMDTSVSGRFETHRVFNQPLPLAGHNAYVLDALVRDAVAREGAAWGEPLLVDYGSVAGHALMALGVEANTHAPELHAYDRFGERIDQVIYHPAYHGLMRHGVEAGVHALSWQHPDRPGAHIVRAALHFLHGQADQGTTCPLTMTHAAMPVLQQGQAFASAWISKANGSSYDTRDVPWWEKSAVLLGMGMTEKQGGSDVRANTSRAYAVADEAYEIVGHKWFMSAPMCDGFIVLAQADAGLTCFLMPRWRNDGTRNAIRIQRLKDKLGNRSNASSEVEFQGAWASRLGEEGRGVATILQMVALTRLDCILGSASVMRQALTQAIHHARHRQVFGQRLVDQPLMTNVLADMALEVEAAVGLAMRVARAVDASGQDSMEAAFARIATAAGKYLVCKRAPVVVCEALECLGGSGYVEEASLARLYRDAPLNSIWEGCGNIQCLDVLRGLERTPGARQAIATEFERSLGRHAAFDREVSRILQWFDTPMASPAEARAWVERLAIVMQAAVLLRGKHTAVADLFCESRLTEARRYGLGALPRSEAHQGIVHRASIEP